MDLQITTTELLEELDRNRPAMACFPESEMMMMMMMMTTSRAV
jgi:hypothetical protein